MALKALYALSPTTTTPTFAAVTASDTAVPGNNVFIVFRNTDSAVKSITVVGQKVLESGATFPDKVYALAVGNVTMQEVWIPLPLIYANATTGLATITTTAAITGVTSALVQTYQTP